MKHFLTPISDWAPPVYGYTLYYSGTKVPIPTYLIVCQAFRDDAGKYPFAKTITLEPKDKTGPYALPPFGKQRFSRVKVLPGSILCSDAAGINAYVKSRPADGIPVVKAVPRRYVDIRTEVDEDDARYRADDSYVLADNAVYPFTVKPTYVTTIIDRGYPGDDWLRTGCQFYEDKNGTKSIGPRFRDFGRSTTRGDPNYRPGKVQSISCRLLSPEEFLLDEPQFIS